MLSENRRVYINWLQGLTGVKSNIITDELSKEGVYLEKYAATNLQVLLREVR